jgi:hypothetical protein
MNETKTPWRKNLDKRYISGEDLINGVEMGKGLRKEMIVTLAKYVDAPAFDQKLQKEVDKTAVWLKEYPSGKMLYKPALLNVANGEFLSKEIGNNSMFLDDFDMTKPFIIYAMPDKRHGHVARFKKYYAPPTITDVNALKLLSASKTINELTANWGKLTPAEKNLPTVLAKKDSLKTQLK